LDIIDNGHRRPDKRGGTADLAKDYGATSEEIMDALAYERAA